MKIECHFEKWKHGKRKCRKCNKFLSLSYFNVSKTSKKGKGGYCPDCRVADQAKRYKMRCEAVRIARIKGLV